MIVEGKYFDSNEKKAEVKGVKEATYKTLEKVELNERTPITIPVHDISEYEKKDQTKIKMVNTDNALAEEILSKINNAEPAKPDLTLDELFNPNNK
ncbi:MAG: hypothetical protein K6D02_01215 [Lachnospiraceae bacterium]|nr:hypothetical protein [Lachnospiraceae bacterium]